MVRRAWLPALVVSVTAVALVATLGIRPAATRAADPTSVSIFDFDVAWSRLAGGGSYTAPLAGVRLYSGERLVDLVGGSARFSRIASSQRQSSTGELVDCSPAPRCYAIEIDARFRLREPQRFPPAMSPSWCAHFNKSPGLISGVSCMADIRMTPVGDGRTWRVRGETWPREEFVLSATKNISIVVGQPACPRPLLKTPADPTLLSLAARNRLVSDTLRDAETLLKQRAALAPLRKAERSVVFVQGVLTGLAELPHLARDVGVVVYSLASTGEYPALEPISLLGQAWQRELEAGTPPWLIAGKTAAVGVAVTVVPYAAEAFFVGGVAASVIEGDDLATGTNLALGFNVIVGKDRVLQQKFRSTAPVRACGCAQTGKPSLVKTPAKPLVKTPAKPPPFDFKLISTAEAVRFAKMAKKDFAGGHGLTLIPVRNGKGTGTVIVASKKAWADAMGLTEAVQKAKTCTGKAVNPQRRWDTELLGLLYVEKAYAGTDHVLMFGLKDPCPNCRSYTIGFVDRTGIPVRYWSAESNRWFNFAPR